MAEREPVNHLSAVRINEADRRISIVSMREKKKRVEDDIEFPRDATEQWAFFRSLAGRPKQIVNITTLRYELIRQTYENISALSYDALAALDSIFNENRIFDLYDEVQGLLGPHGSLIERVTKDEQGRAVPGFRMTVPVFVVKNAATS